MQIIIAILIAGLLWMIYDLMNAPEVDDNENFITPMSDSENDESIKNVSESQRKAESNVSEIE